MPQQPDPDHVTEQTRTVGEPLSTPIHSSEPQGETAPEAAALVPAQVGRYAIKDELGHGGMGIVLRGHDPDFHRHLAVKILLARHRGKPDLERRFLEEAQVTAQLQHPGVPPVHEVGRLEDGRPFFSMKLVKGRTLADLLKERADPAAELPQFLAIFTQVCQTLAYVHSRGILHRDLKPSNIMVGAFGEVQVMDWGLAKVRGKVEESERPGGEESVIATVRTLVPDLSSQAGSVLGTPAIVVELAAALDEWALATRDGGRRRPLVVARLADPDPWRNRLRVACEERDLNSLRALVQEAQERGLVESLPLPTLQLLGKALLDAGDASAAEDWLRGALERHPGDVWLNHGLAAVFRRGKGAESRLTEAIRFYTAARAVRPEVAHDLAHALEAKGERAASEAVLRDLIRIRPNNARPPELPEPCPVEARERGRGVGLQPSGLDEQERARLRRQALEWLRADLEIWARAANTAPMRPALLQAIQRWQTNGQLAAVRDTEELARLPREEQEAFKKLWADVAALLERVRQEK